MPEQAQQGEQSVKRRRVTRACDECRKKKVKCDGQQPCIHCTVYSYECTYKKPTKRTQNSGNSGVLTLGNVTTGSSSSTVVAAAASIQINSSQTLKQKGLFYRVLLQYLQVTIHLNQESIRLRAQGYNRRLTGTSKYLMRSSRSYLI